MPAPVQTPRVPCRTPQSWQPRLMRRQVKLLALLSVVSLQPGDILKDERYEIKEFLRTGQEKKIYLVRVLHALGFEILNTRDRRPPEVC